MIRKTHLDLDVLLARSENGYQAEILRSPAGDGQQATFARPFSDLELENFVLKVGRAKLRTRRVDAAPVATAKQFGGRLFDAVFAGATGECLRRSVDYARDHDATLRIRLRLSGCPELGDLPWELLYDRSDDWFLALSGQTPVIRYVRLPQQPRAVPVTLPLRVLVIKSEPVDCPQLDLEVEWAKVAASLAHLTDRGMVVFTELAAATLGDLRQALLRDAFHVLHYMGHGAFDAQRGGMLLFTDRSGRSLPVTSGDLGVMLHDHTSMRLAVLNACEAGRTDPADPFAGVADTLVRRGIPAVVAMQFEVSDEAAIEFAPALYGALADGLPVDAALGEARKAMYTISPLEWATPVLYLRADDARLFDISREKPPNESAEPAQAAAHLQRGDNLLDQHRYADAEIEYRIALAVNPRLAEAHTGLGRALTRLRRYADAEAECREAVRINPASALAHSFLGAVLVNLKRFPEAEAECREAIRLDPALAQAHSSLAAVLATLKRFPEAETECREAIRLDPALARAYSILGIVLGNLERIPEAEAKFREAIRLDPALATAHFGLSALLFDLNRFPEAETECREAIRLDPALASAHSTLGAVLLKLNRYPEAEAECREAIRLDPALAVSYSNLSAVLLNLNRYPEAEAECRKAIRLDPTLARAHANLGASFQDAQRYPEQEAAYREAIRLDPALALAHFGLGTLLLNLKRYPEAEAELRETIRLDPASALVHNNLGALFQGLKRYPEAEAEYGEAIRLEPGLALAHKNLGDVLTAMRRYREAKISYQEAIRLDPRYGTAEQMGGRALNRIKNWLG